VPPIDSMTGGVPITRTIGYSIQNSRCRAVRAPQETYDSRMNRGSGREGQMDRMGSTTTIGEAA
jgi:hypothetical protein